MQDRLVILTDVLAYNHDLWKCKLKTEFMPVEMSLALLDENQSSVAGKL
jgi:hypothetical protein